MSIATKTKAGSSQIVADALETYGFNREELIPILGFVNKKLGYLPGEAMEEISSLLHIPESQVLSVASFYDMLSTKPRGRHVVKFCESAPCHVVGGRELWQALQDELKIEPHQTTPDGKWTLVTTSCLGVCAVGPVIIIDDDIYGNVTPTQLRGIFARYK